MSIRSDKPVVRVRRGKKDPISRKNGEKNDSSDYKHSINKDNSDEIYEKVDPDNDPDLVEARVEKKEFFERARCRFGKPDPLAATTHFRTHHEARILTRGDRDIIVKRTTEDVDFFVVIYIQINY